MAVKFAEKPSGELAQALARAKELKSQLAAAADELNRSIADAEAAIVALQIGVRASVVLEEDPQRVLNCLLKTAGSDIPGPLCCTCPPAGQALHTGPCLPQFNNL